MEKILKKVMRRTEFPIKTEKGFQKMPMDTTIWSEDNTRMVLVKGKNHVRYEFQKRRTRGSSKKFDIDLLVGEEKRKGKGGWRKKDHDWKFFLFSFVRCL